MLGLPRLHNILLLQDCRKRFQFLAGSFQSRMVPGQIGQSVRHNVLHLSQRMRLDLICPDRCPLNRQFGLIGLSGLHNNLYLRLYKRIGLLCPDRCQQNMRSGLIGL